MKQYGEAAQMDMQLRALTTYFEQLPAIAKAAGEAYTNVDSIKMYGGDSSQLAGNIVNTITQISDGLGESLFPIFNAELSEYLRYCHGA